MRLSFHRSGGFAGRASEVRGSVSFEGGQARVSSENPAYERVLSAEESATLVAATASAHLQAAPENAPRDAYQYHATITDEDGQPRQTVLQDGNNNELAEWLKRESQEIWKVKIAESRKRT